MPRREGDSHQKSPSLHSETRRSAYFEARHFETPVFERAQLKPGVRISGPAIVTENLSTTIIEPGWEAEVLGGSELLLPDLGEGTGKKDRGDKESLHAPAPCSLLSPQTPSS